MIINKMGVLLLTTIQRFTALYTHSTKYMSVNKLRNGCLLPWGNTLFQYLYPIPRDVPVRSNGSRPRGIDEQILIIIEYEFMNLNGADVYRVGH